MKLNNIAIIGLILAVIAANLMLFRYYTLLSELKTQCSMYDTRDVNKDGKVDILDLLIVQKKIISQKESEDR